MVNLGWCSNLEVIEESTEPPEPILHLNHTKVSLTIAFSCASCRNRLNRFFMPFQARKAQKAQYRQQKQRDKLNRHGCFIARPKSLFHNL